MENESYIVDRSDGSLSRVREVDLLKVTFVELQAAEWATPLASFDVRYHTTVAEHVVAR